MDQKNRQHRHHRIRRRLHGTATRPRACVFRSARYINLQLIDDNASQTLFTVSSKKMPAESKIAQAEAVGKKAAGLALAKNITAVIYDRAGYQYHGRVKAVAEGLRAGGLKF